MCIQTQLLLKVVRLRIKDLSQIKQIGLRVITRMIRDPIDTQSYNHYLFTTQGHVYLMKKKTSLPLRRRKRKIIKGIKGIAHTWGWFLNCMEKRVRERDNKFLFISLI